MKKNILTIGLSSIVIVTTLELLFYFIYIFKPIDRIMGKDISTPRGLPTASELFTPILLNKYITTSNETKTLYSGRLSEFENSLKNKMAENSSFIKVAESNYVVGGEVVSITPAAQVNTGVPVAFDITLKNTLNKKEYIEKISSVEAMYLKTYLIRVNLKDFSRELISLGQIKAGDYLVVKRSTNLLNPSETNIEIEILRSEK